MTQLAWPANSGRTGSPSTAYARARSTTEVEERVASLTPEVRQRNIDLQCIPRTIVPSDLVGLVDVPGHACRRVHHRPDHRLRRWLHPQLLTGELTRRSDHGTLRKTSIIDGAWVEPAAIRVGRSLSIPPPRRLRDSRHWRRRRQMSTTPLPRHDKPSRPIPGPRVDERIALIDRIIAAYEQRVDEIADVMAQEVGIPVSARAQATGPIGHMKVARDLLQTTASRPSLPIRSSAASRSVSAR